MGTNIFELILQCENPNSSPFLNSLVSYQNYWSSIRGILDKLFQDHEFDKNYLTEVWVKINQNSPSLVGVTINYYIDDLNQKLANSYQKDFFGSLGELDESEETLSLDRFLKAFQYLNHVFQIHKSFATVLELNDFPSIARENNIENHMILGNVIDKFKIAILNTKQFRRTLFSFLNLQYLLFKNYLLGMMSNEADGQELEVFQYEKNQQTLDYQFNSQILTNISEVLCELDYFDKIHDLIFIFTVERLESFANSREENADNPSGNPYLHRLLDYFQRFLKSFIQIIYSKVIQKDEKIKASLTDLISRLVYFIYELYAKKLTTKMFDIILDAEEIDINILHEIREATEKSHTISHLAQALVQQVKSRLLIPGIITQSIINCFINTVKILQLIDPTGIIYDTVTNPMKNYLLQRPDALRGIITILTEDSDSYTRLGQESITIPTDQSADNHNDVSSDEDEKAAETWQVVSGIKYKVSDMVTWLVNLYGSQEAFINEYQNMLGEKLVGGKEYKIDEEIKNLELLKAKFGDNHLQNCQIIVRDIKDSKRINNNIHRKYDEEFKRMDLETLNPALREAPAFPRFDKLNAVFLSKSYWPINYDYEAFKIPANIQKTFDQYSQSYSATKAMRRLIWHHSLGWVDLSLEFENGSFDFKCLPTHAILISYFDEQTNPEQGVSLEFLSAELGMPAGTVRQLMSFWVHKGVVFEKKTQNSGVASIKKSHSMAGYFAVSEQVDIGSVFYVPAIIYDGSQNENWDINEDVENELLKGGELSGDATQFNTLIEGLIINMLKTNGPKSVEKIQQLLKTVYKTDIPYNYTENQTKEILKKMLTVKVKVPH